MSQNPADGVRDIGTFAKGLHRRRHTDEYVYALDEVHVDFFGVNVHVVTFVDMTTGVTVTAPYNGDDLPFGFEAEPAWTDGVYDNVQQEGDPLSRFQLVEPPAIPAPFVIEVVDVIRICLQLSVAEPDWAAVRLRMIDVLGGALDTTVSLAKRQILVDTDPNTPPYDELDSEDWRAIYLSIANDLMAEANLVVT